jgi:hypothetical protein
MSVAMEGEDDLSLHENYVTLPSERTIFLNRDFIKHGQKRVLLSEFTKVHVYMWDNRYERELVFNRSTIPPVSEDYLLRTFEQVNDFRSTCQTSINRETKAMLTQKVRDAVRNDTTACTTTWRMASKTLNALTLRTKDISIAFNCCYGASFSGNWAVYAQTRFMKRNNIEWRDWDLVNRPCPGGFFAHIFTSTKGHHVKLVDYVNSKSGNVAKLPTRDSGTTNNSGSNRMSIDDPNMVDIRTVASQFKEHRRKGNPTFEWSDIRKILSAIRRTNNRVTARVANTRTAGEQDQSTFGEDDEPATMHLDSGLPNPDDDQEGEQEEETGEFCDDATTTSLSTTHRTMSDYERDEFDDIGKYHVDIRSVFF